MNIPENSNENIEIEKRRERHERRVRTERVCYLIFGALVLCLLVGVGALVMKLVQNRPGDDPVVADLPSASPLINVSPSPIEPLPSEEPVPSEDPRDELDDLVDLYMASMSLEEKVYGLFFVTPEAITGVSTATKAGNSTKEAIEKQPVGGIVYFAKNITGATQFKEMLLNTQKYAKYPMFLGIDEEGGSVARLGNSKAGVAQVKNMSEIGATMDSMEAYSAYITISTYLKDYGINVNFAPVADVLTDSTSDSLKKRIFSSDPELTAQMVRSSVTAMQDQGISATLKHFPGLGSVSEDTHNASGASAMDLTEFSNTCMAPFASGIEAGADFIMVSHASYPNITGTDEPASMSSYIINDILREVLGYNGIVITDALNMAAITGRYTCGEACVQALKAGADMLLMPESLSEGYNAILTAVQNGEISEERINESIHRIYRVKYKEAINGPLG